MKETELLGRLNRVLAEAVKAPFYRDRLKTIKQPITSLKDYERIPVLSKADCIAHCPPAGESMLTRRHDHCYLFSAGGTTGQPTYVYYGVEEHRAACRALGFAMRECGIGPEDTVVNCFQAGALWTGFLVTNAGLEETGCRILSLTGNHSIGDTLNYIQSFRPTVVLGLCEFLSGLARETMDRNLDLHIGRVLYAGGHMSGAARKFIHQAWGTEKIGSLCYAAVETGPIGYQCPHCRGGEHHVLEDWAYVEREEDGNILVTTLERLMHPILRARIGDRIEWVDEPCACGSASPKFVLKGRADDLVRFHGNLFSVPEVDKVLSGFPELTPEFQIELNPMADFLDIRIRVESRGKAAVNLETQIIAALAEDIPCFGSLREKNRIRNLEVEFFSPGGLPRAARTGKVRRIIDNRRK